MMEYKNRKRKLFFLVIAFCFSSKASFALQTFNEFYLDYRIEFGKRLYQNIDIPLYQKKVIQIYNNLLEEYPYKIELYWQIAKIFWLAGELSISEDDKKDFFKMSKQWINKGYKLETDNIEIRLWRGIIYGSRIIHSGVFNVLLNKNQVKNDLDFVVEKQPNNVRALTALAYFYHKIPPQLGGNAQKAYELCNHILQIDNSIPLVYVIIAEYLMQNSRKEEAYQILQRGLTVKASIEKVYANLIKKQIYQIKEKLR